MFQTSGLFSDLCVFDNIAFPIRENFAIGEDLVRRLVLMKLDAVGLRGARDMMPGDLSGGMTRRVALARAIATDPMLAMYDEPFAGLDPISMGVAANLIRSLNDSTGGTSLVVSHDVQECFQICDYAYLMSSQGRVVAHGSPDELNASEHPEVRQFIRGEPDGPVRFHYPAKPLAEDLQVPA
jgi:phospholipid/cholesterol/gamma-HCH transport system ATP-binding protein